MPIKVMGKKCMEFLNKPRERTSLSIDKIYLCIAGNYIRVRSDKKHRFQDQLNFLENYYETLFNIDLKFKFLMSFRQCRNLCEMLRYLNYPRLISLENFIKPNFELVADILYWLAQRYDPQTQIPDDINQQKQRVQFMKTIVNLFYTKARIKLNAKRLYQADSEAVQEILKIVHLLYKASISKGIEEQQVTSISLPVKVSNLKAHKVLATQICDLGTRLYDAISKQPQLRKIRSQAIQFLDGISGSGGEGDQAYIEKCVKQIMHQQNQSMSQMTKYVSNMERQQKSLEQKLKKKSAQLQRAEKRYKSLVTVKPAFMQQYQRLEQQLQGMYQIYVEKYRNIDYLESQLQRYNKTEQEKLAKAKKQLEKIQKKVKQQQMKDFKRVQELDDGLLEPEVVRGFTRGNSRKKQQGQDEENIRAVQPGQQDEDDQEQDDEEGEDQSGEDIDDDDSNF